MNARSLQSCLTLCHPWTVASQGPLSMAFSRQRYLSGLPCPRPGHLPTQESLMSPAMASGFFTTSITCEALNILCRSN